MIAKQTGVSKKKFDLIELNENISRLIEENDRQSINYNYKIGMKEKKESNVEEENLGSLVYRKNVT